MPSAITGKRRETYDVCYYTSCNGYYVVMRWDRANRELIADVDSDGCFFEQLECEELLLKLEHAIDPVAMLEDWIMQSFMYYPPIAQAIAEAFAVNQVAIACYVYEV